MTLCYIDVGKSPRGASWVEKFALHQVAPIIGGNLSHLCICISFGVFVFVFGLFYLYLCISITVWAICFAPQGLKMLYFDVLRLYVLWYDGPWYYIDVGASQIWQFVLHQVATNDGFRLMKAFISQRTLCVHHTFIVILISVLTIFYKYYLIYLFRTHRCLPGQSFL